MNEDWLVELVNERFRAHLQGWLMGKLLELLDAHDLLTSLGVREIRGEIILSLTERINILVERSSDNGSVFDLNLPPRICGILARAGLRTVAQVSDEMKQRDPFFAVNGIGPKSTELIREALLVHEQGSVWSRSIITKS